MNFTKFDVSILLTMSLAVIVMSFAFPALGMSDQGSVNESDVPEFNASSTQFDLVGEYPNQPDQPTSGQLTYDNQDGNSINGVNQKWIDRPKESGALIELRNTSQDGAQVVLTDFINSTSSENTKRFITGQEGQDILINDYFGYTIQVTITSVSNYDQPDMEIKANYDIRDDPDDSSGVASIPIIGSTADAVANILGTIAVAFAWGSAVLVETAISGVIAVFNLSQYLLSMGFWLVTTYGSVVSAAPSWAGVVLAVPGILLFAEFAKVTAIIISLFPTT